MGIERREEKGMKLGESKTGPLCPRCGKEALEASPVSCYYFCRLCFYQIRQLDVVKSPQPPRASRSGYPWLTLPPWEADYYFHPTKRWRFDWAWPQDPYRIAVDQEGGIWTYGRRRRGS